MFIANMKDVARVMEEYGVVITRLEQLEHEGNKISVPYVVSLLLTSS